MENLTPITREEKIISGEDLQPITRMEYFLKKYGGGTGGGGGGSSVSLDKTLTKSGYAADAKAVGDRLAEIGNGGGGIIDVTELPTTNIDENALYRTIVPTFYMDGKAQSTTIHIVNGLPTSGDPFTLDGQTLNAGYYNNNDGVLYFYVTEELAAMGLPVGWLTADQIAQIFDAMLAGGAGMITYGGVFVSQADVVGNPYMYLIVQRPLYFYKDGKWREVATEGATLSLKTKKFTSWDDALAFCFKHEVYKIQAKNLWIATKNAGGQTSSSQYYCYSKTVMSDNSALRIEFSEPQGGDGNLVITYYIEDGIFTFSEYHSTYIKSNTKGEISWLQITNVDSKDVTEVIVQYFA